jgi:predicted helicase
MTIQDYLQNLNSRFKTGISREHSYRADLQNLISALVPDVLVTNEPARVACGAPDYIITKRNIPVGFIEAKDIGEKDLDGLKSSGNKEQFDRYKASLNNLIFTDYLNFHLYRDGQLVSKISIGEIYDKGIKPLPENYDSFSNLIKGFCSHVGQTIKSPRKLAEMMANKARLLADVIEKALTSDESNQEDSTLKDQYNAFKHILIHDITPRGFADVYAQTIAYGMFAARLHDPSLDNFSRQEAAELIPKSNPFLRKLFGYIAGPDIDDRIKWIVDNLAEVFLACNVLDLLKNFGKSTKMEDPIIHFYETFLSEYDPKLRKARGVWYTPQPVVDFIVRAVDDILKTEFDLPQGLADTSKVKIKVKDIGKATADMRSKPKEIEREEEVHRVQILDPATGTGTFLAEVVKHIYKMFEGQQGIWNNYVENHLITRLNGFELLMASYAMAHLKLELLLTETGFTPTKNQRLRVFLTNSLEEHHPDTGTLFASWLSNEASEANFIKRDTPVMCVIGNPPYSGESANKGEWIMNLMEDYKKEPGSNVKLKEKNSKAINADEYKFIRYGQHYIEKNGSGILAFINPHTFLDASICRGMRWNLLKTFDKIFTIDLHGNSTKKETALDGSADANVFDIMQGVSINIFVKTGKKKANEFSKVFHFDLFGKRELKYDFLFEKSIKSVGYKEISVKAPNYYFVPKDFNEERDYSKGFELTELIPLKTSGIKTHDDVNFVSDSRESLENNLIKLNQVFDKSKVFKYSYRPFDNGYIYYDTKLLGRAREKTIYHLKNDNLGLILVSQPQAANLNFFDCVYITNCFTDTNMFRRGGPCAFPLYIYPTSTKQFTIGQTTERTPNLNPVIVKQIVDGLGLHFTNEKADTEALDVAPIDILDYIYAVLHSPTYREKYKEFLKIDFPRVPYPTDKETFWQLVKLGGELRQLHLLETSKVNEPITTYPFEGDNVVEKVRFVMYEYQNQIPDENGVISYPDYLGSVYINDKQCFSDVPVSAWEFYIGGYQPAQKWLKDRKNRELSYDDILHYQKIIVALTETARLMKEIDEVGVV